MTSPARAKPGPKRAVTASPAELDQLVDAARQLGQRTEAARQQMLALSAERQKAILAVHNAGLSIRETAAALQVSPEVVATAVRRARAGQTDNAPR